MSAETGKREKYRREIRIVLDKPDTVFTPGRTITGKVVVSSDNEMVTRGLLIKFEGKVTVHYLKQSGNALTFSKSGAQMATKITHAHDNFERMFTYEIYLVGNGSKDVKLLAGASSFGFTFKLPSRDIPSSFVGPYGKIEYTLEAQIMRAQKSEYVAMLNVPVQAIVDLNDTDATKPGEWTLTRRFGCFCCARPLKITTRLQTRAFYSNDIIYLEVEINNLSGKKFKDLSAAIVQEVKYISKDETRESTDTLASVTKLGGIDPGQHEIWKEELKIPASTPPSNLGGCRFIDVEYSVVITAQGSGNPLKLTCPIKIGTVPQRRATSKSIVT